MAEALALRTLPPVPFATAPTAAPAPPPGLPAQVEALVCAPAPFAPASFAPAPLALADAPAAAPHAAAPTLGALPAPGPLAAPGDGPSARELSSAAAGAPARAEAVAAAAADVPSLMTAAAAAALEAKTALHFRTIQGLFLRQLSEGALGAAPGVPAGPAASPKGGSAVSRSTVGKA